MSYCRFSDGDVYMYPTNRGIECCACRLTHKNANYGLYENKLFDTGEEALAHLKEHINAGHKVPKYATDRLKEEINETKIEQSIKNAHKRWQQ
jgi:hypothetical protein